MNDGEGLFGCRPILNVDCIARSIEYYVESLGFYLGWSWSDNNRLFLQPGNEGEPTFALVGRGREKLMLSQKSQGALGVWLHLDVELAAQLDALHEEWKRKGARIVEPPSHRTWSTYEIRVRGLDGRALRVSAPAP